MQTETVLLANEAFDADINVKAYCDMAQELIVRNNKSLIGIPLAV